MSRRLIVSWCRFHEIEKLGWGHDQRKPAWPDDTQQITVTGYQKFHVVPRGGIQQVLVLRITALYRGRGTHAGRERDFPDQREQVLRHGWVDAFTKIRLFANLGTYFLRDTWWKHEFDIPRDDMGYESTRGGRPLGIDEIAQEDIRIDDDAHRRLVVRLRRGSPARLAILGQILLNERIGRLFREITVAFCL